MRLPARRLWAWSAVCMLASGPVMGASKLRHPLVGHAAPEVLQHLQTGPAGNFRLSDHRGEVVLLGFWTSWCADCADYLSRLRSLESTYESAGLVVLAVSLDEDRKAAREFIRQPLNSLRTSNDEPSTVGKLYDVADVPMTVLIDRDGVVRYVHVVNDHASQVAVQRELRQLLDE